MTQHLCFCLGYESLVIPFKLFNEGEKSITILSNREDIIQLCHHFGIKYHIIPEIGFEESITKYTEVKAKIETFLENIVTGESVFHFTHKNYDSHIPLIALALPNYKCIFHKSEIDLEEVYKFPLFYGRTIRKMLKFYIMYLCYYKAKFAKIYGLELTYRKVFDRIIPNVEMKSLKENGIDIINYSNVDHLYYETYSKLKNDLEPAENLFLVPDYNEYKSWVTERSLAEFLNYIDSFDNIIYKYHPNRKTMSEKKQYPRFIPAEIIVPHITKNIISPMSFAFRYSLKYKNINTISTLELLEWTDQKQKKLFKEKLLSWGCKLFPKSYEELGEMLRS